MKKKYINWFLLLGIISGCVSTPRPVFTNTDGNPVVDNILIEQIEYCRNEDQRLVKCPDLGSFRLGEDGIERKTVTRCRDKKTGWFVKCPE